MPCVENRAIFNHQNWQCIANKSVVVIRGKIFRLKKDIVLGNKIISNYGNWSIMTAQTAYEAYKDNLQGRTRGWHTLKATEEHAAKSGR